MYKKFYPFFLSLLLGLSLFSCSSQNEKNLSKKEVTLTIIKPDAVADNNIGKIINRFETNGLRVAAIKMVELDKGQVEQFYKVHKDKPFYDELTEFMSSGPAIVMVLEGDEAVSRNREIIGSTNPKTAGRGTVRRDFSTSIGKNAVHGSDSKETAQNEILFFFTPEEISTRY